MGILIPISICAILPISIVLIIFLALMNSDNKRAKVLIKAIESGNGVDADKLAAAMQKPRKTPRELLNSRLLRGCIFSFIGIALIILGILSLVNGVDFESDPVFIPVMFGSASLAIGISYLIVYFLTRNQVKD